MIPAADVVTVAIDPRGTPRAAFVFQGAAEIFDIVVYKRNHAFSVG